MVYIHIGNNVFFGTDRDEIPNPSTNSVFTNVLTGDLSTFGVNVWTTRSYGGKTDQNVISITRQIPLTNIGTTYTDIFGAFYDGFPIPLDCNGYTNLGVILLWNKNSGTGIHDIRIINNANPSQVFVDSEGIRIENGYAQDGLKSGRTVNYNVTIPDIFKTFRGEVRIQAKSTVGTDDPIFDGFWLYLIR